MNEKQALSFGTWPSKLTADRLTAATVRMGNIQFFRGEILWTEGRPEEGGRNALSRRTEQGEIETVLPEPWNVRTRVHEYGGLSFHASETGILFSNFKDSRLYLATEDGQVTPITPNNEHRYAAPVEDPGRNSWIAVREIMVKGESEPRNELVRIKRNGTVLPLVEGADFYADPEIGRAHV